MVLVWDLKSSRLLRMVIDKTIYYPDNMLTSMIFDQRDERLVLSSKRIHFWPVKSLLNYLLIEKYSIKQNSKLVEQVMMMKLHFVSLIQLLTM